MLLAALGRVIDLKFIPDIQLTRDFKTPFKIALVATFPLKEFSYHWFLVLVSPSRVSLTSSKVCCRTWVLVSQGEEKPCGSRERQGTPRLTPAALWERKRVW